jgi:S1-C subfamily serine protease
VEWNDGTDDDQYPIAPVPTHERAWRHPSEIGQAQWTRTEPPLTIGRGLVAATTTLGCLLAVAVVWAMWPATGGGVTAISTVVSTVVVPAAQSEPSPTTSSVGLIEAASSTSFAPPRATSAGPVTTAPAPATTAPRRIPPQSSVPASVETVPAAALPRAAAVSVNGDLLLVTTALAVADRRELLVTFDGFGAVNASVVVVDQRSGLAVLAAEPAAIAGVTQLVVGTGPTDLTPVKAFSAESTELDLVADESGLLWVAGWSSPQAPVDTPEGMPLVDEAGALVGLCSHRGDGMVLVKVDLLTDLLVQQIGPTPSWMGVVLDSTAAGPLTIGFVEPDGPAALAGLRSGDVIVAVDNIPMLTQADLDAALDGRQPGDEVSVSVRRDASTVTARIVLAATTAAL